MQLRSSIAFFAALLLSCLVAGCYVLPSRPDRGGDDSDDDDSQPSDDDDDATPPAGDDDDVTQPAGDDDDATSPPGDDDDDDDDDATPPAANGPLCDIADSFECGVSNSGSNGGGSNEESWAQCVSYGAGYTGGEAVFEWQASQSGYVSVSLNWSDGSADLDLFVLSGCDLSSLTCLGESSGTTTGESVSVNVTEGSWYYVVVDGWDGGSASFTITTNEDCSGSPGDDDDATPPGGDDDDAAGGDYGPDNDWFHADVSDVPSGLNGTGWNNGDTAYNFTLTDQNGDQVELYQFYGKVVMLDLFAEWCGPCNDMAPEGEAMWNAGGGEVIILAVMEENAWGGAPGATDAARWESTHGLSHPVVADPGYSLGSYVSAYPTYIAIDRTMTIVDANFWPDLGYLLSL